MRGHRKRAEQLSCAEDQLEVCFGVVSGHICCYAIRMSANDYDLELEQLEERATGRLASADTFDGAAFEALYNYISDKARDLREVSVVSKQILRSLRQAAATIRSRSEYLASVHHQLPVADRFEMLLDLIIIGEHPDDRKPGTPRII